MSDGKDYLVYVSLDDTDNDTPANAIEVEFQGDLTINTGKAVNTTTYKNGQRSSTSLSGFNASFSMGNKAPLSQAEAKIWQLHDDETAGFVYIKNSLTGGLEFKFPAKVAIPTLNAPVSNPAEVQVVFSADGTVTRGTAA